MAVLAGTGTPTGKSDETFRHGEQIPSAKLCIEDVEHLRDLRARGVPERDLAVAFGICQTTINRIVRGELWKSAGGPITPRKKRKAA